MDMILSEDQNKLNIFCRDYIAEEDINGRHCETCDLLSAPFLNHSITHCEAKSRKDGRNVHWKIVPLEQ